jgi:adenylate kinase
MFLGPPAAGKGTAADILSERLNAPHVSTGQMFREAIRQGGTLAATTREFIDKGQLVPDEVTIQIVRLWLDQHGRERGFIFDGFPRTLPQAKAFDRLLAERQLPLTLVILMEISEAEVLKRMLGRLSCEKCGALYHEPDLQPKRAGVCDKCGGRLVRRADDTEATLRERLQVYRDLTMPVVEHYAATGLLRRVNAAGLYERKFADLLQLVSA